ncbi:hypothetical protein QBC35DRAFT_454569 [Podospora australis]|uniref:Uncharacterized protein n=1 Tax=Podospora australis TaxID=1536484 RepID=A0AAN6WN16_9PEZI|nr:hypothetical protein QBC35DRAFT_454569 [Podospora australis]
MKFIAALATIVTAVSAVTISLPSGVSIPSGVTLPSGVTVVTAAPSATAEAAAGSDSDAKKLKQRGAEGGAHHYRARQNIPGLQSSSATAQTTAAADRKAKY